MTRQMAYNRAGAIEYARVYWDKVCHDGRIACNWTGDVIDAKRTQGLKALCGSAPPGTTMLPGNMPTLPPVETDDDCTHFISCCIGFAGPTPTGGCLPIDQLWQGNPFGFDNPDGLINNLLTKRLAVIVGEKFRPFFIGDPEERRAAETAIGSELRIGDLVALANSNQKWQHFVIIVEMTLGPLGPKPLIACHSDGRWRQPVTVFGNWARYATLIKIVGG